MSEIVLHEISLERVIAAVEAVHDRLRRATAALERARVPYAVVGGNAVAIWVARVDRAAVRNTQDVDIVLRRADLDAAKAALAEAGFVYRHVKGIDMFLDGPRAKARDAVHVLFAGEKVRPDDPIETPDVDLSESEGAFRVISLEPLVRMKLTLFRLKDKVHLLDMIDVGLVDATWLDRLPPELSNRLKEVLDNPEA